MSQAAAQSSLTVLAPVRDGELDHLRDVVSLMPKGAQSPFARVASTHFARFVIVPSLLDGDGEPVGQRSYLLFTADFDGATERWMEEIAQLSGDELDDALEHCDGYPGSRDAAAFRAYLRRHDVGAGFSVISYAATVERIRSSLTRQRELRALAERAGALSAGELQSEWRSRFAG
jgi:hypothetical protein